MRPLSQTTYPIAQRRTNTQTQLRRQSASHTHTHAHTQSTRVTESREAVRTAKLAWLRRNSRPAKELAERGRRGRGYTTTNPNPNPNRGRGLSLARLECGQRQSRCSGALPLAAPAPLRIELRLLDFQNRRGELRLSILVVRTCSHFRRAPPSRRTFLRRKAPCPAQRKKKNEQRASSLICARFVGLMRANLVRSPVRRWWPA